MKTHFFPSRMLARLGVSPAGCKASEALHAESSAAAVRFAEALGARSVRLADRHLELAKQGLQAAATLGAVGKADQAYSRRVRADIDVDLAVMLSLIDRLRLESPLPEAVASVA